MSQTDNISVDATLLSDGLIAALHTAEASANQSAGKVVTPVHLLNALLQDRDTIAVLASNSVDTAALYRELSQRLSALAAPPPMVAQGAGVAYANELHELLATAARAVGELGQSQITGVTLLIVMLGREQDEPAQILRRYGLTLAGAVQALKRLQKYRAPQAHQQPAGNGRFAAGEQRTLTNPAPHPAAPAPGPPHARGRRIDVEAGAADRRAGHAAPPQGRPPPSVADVLREQFSRPPPQKSEAPPGARSKRRVSQPPGAGYGGAPPPGNGEAYDEAAMAETLSEAQSPDAAPPTGTGHGFLVENIPRAMTAFMPVTVEARIARAQSDALYRDLLGDGAASQHDIIVTQAMTVQLRAPDGGFTIESATPDTQWIDNQLGAAAANDFGRWRWTVTPTKKGSAALHVVISARTVNQSGLVAESPLPDQVIEVRVAVNYLRQFKFAAGWAIAAIAGGVLGRYGETAANWLFSKF